MANILSLPLNILHEIFRYLNITDLISVSQVSKSWRANFTKDQIWLRLLPPTCIKTMDSYPGDTAMDRYFSFHRITRNWKRKNFKMYIQQFYNNPDFQARHVSMNTFFTVYKTKLIFAFAHGLIQLWQFENNLKMVCTLKFNGIISRIKLFKNFVVISGEQLRVFKIEKIDRFSFSDARKPIPIENFLCEVYFSEFYVDFQGFAVDCNILAYFKTNSIVYILSLSNTSLLSKFELPFGCKINLEAKSKIVISKHVVYITVKYKSSDFIIGYNMKGEKLYTLPQCGSSFFFCKSSNLLVCYEKNLGKISLSNPDKIDSEIVHLKIETDDSCFITRCDFSPTLNLLAVFDSGGTISLFTIMESRCELFFELSHPCLPVDKVPALELYGKFCGDFLLSICDCAIPICVWEVLSDTVRLLYSVDVDPCIQHVYCNEDRIVLLSNPDPESDYKHTLTMVHFDE